MVKPDIKRKRPFRVTIIGILCIIDGLIFLFPALGKYGIGNLIILSGQTFQSGPFIFAAVIIAIINFIIGIGCLIGWRPIWFYLIIVSIINFALALLVLTNTDPGNLRDLAIGWLWFILAAFGLLVVQSRKTRVWFRISGNS